MVKRIPVDIHKVRPSEGSQVDAVLGSLVNSERAFARERGWSPFRFLKSFPIAFKRASSYRPKSDTPFLQARLTVFPQHTL